MKKFPPVNRVRNVAIAGHIDHGKTTFADHILAEARVIPKSLAGKARYLDYWLEEQRRGITMKTTVISLSTIRNSEDYLIHLIDTPGHVDFSGKVSRALRLADSVIFIVDAAEGVMAQTESYLRLALQEVVRPILFINKIDRLITEIRAGPSQIFSKLSAIIKRFNTLIAKYASDELKEIWQVNPKDDTVIFGSALHGWGFTYSDAQKHAIRFDDIIKFYRKGEISKLRETFPLGRKVIELIINKFYSPPEAQRIRVKYLWRGDIPEALSKCSSSGETVFYVSKVSIEKGRTYITARAFSGTVKPGEYIHLPGGKRKRLQSIFMIHANKLENISEVPAGNIFGGIMDALPGETYSGKLIEGNFIGPRYTVYPVLSVAITPRKYSNIRQLLEIMKKMVIEDPNLFFEVSKDTGQILLYGLGELHLELAIKHINEIVPIYTTKPIVAFKEVPQRKVEISTETLRISIEPTERLSPGSFVSDLKNHIEITGVSTDKKILLETIILNSLRTGPRIGEPIISTKIKIDIQKSVPESEIIQRVYEALSNLQTYIAQPYYSFSIITDCKFLGPILGFLSSRNAKIENVISGDLCEIFGKISVLDSLGLAENLRNISRGHASVQLEYSGFIVANKAEEERIFSYLSEITTTYLQHA